MRIVLFDTILERHLAESLKRALERLGHDVVFTDLIVHGHAMIRAIEDKEKINKVLNEVLSIKTDLLIAFRPMNLLPSVVETISKQTKIAIWLSDDPVLYKSCYKDVIDKYDIILHCGNEKVLKFYEDKGHNKGFNFPFWTDNIAFPVVYTNKNHEYDGVFLGNMHGQVRRRRYKEIAQIPASIKVFGLVDSDPYGIHGGNIKEGYINTKAVSKALSKAKFSLSIPQFFADYKGLKEYEFEELSSLGYFQFPSRIVQYAASALPIVAVGDKDMKKLFPEIEVGNSIKELYPYIEKLKNNREFASEVSLKTHKRFLQSYSAMARALFLVDLVENHSRYSSLSTIERVELFTSYNGNISR